MAKIKRLLNLLDHGPDSGCIQNPPVCIPPYRFSSTPSFVFENLPSK
jgi:hypothetical protein